MGEVTGAMLPWTLSSKWGQVNSTETQALTLHLLYAKPHLHISFTLCSWTCHVKVGTDVCTTENIAIRGRQTLWILPVSWGGKDTVLRLLFFNNRLLLLLELDLQMGEVLEFCLVNHSVYTAIVRAHVSLLAFLPFLLWNVDTLRLFLTIILCLLPFISFISNINHTTHGQSSDGLPSIWCSLLMLMKQAVFALF